MTLESTILRELPVAVYATDADGFVTFYNDKAAELWGHRPELGVARWCGSWRLYWPDGRPMSHDECPMAKTLREGTPVRGTEIVVENPAGLRRTVLPYPTPLTDAGGRVTGAVNALVDVTGRERGEMQSAWLAAVVSSSQDAIVSKTLDGRIIFWNEGATRILGYTAEEMIGQPILRIIPEELHGEEAEILARLRRGERIEHFDTERIARDGSRVHLSLTVSPVRDSAGNVIGASKVARDIGERKRNESLQRLLLDELNHRVKNTLATIQAIANQSLRTSASAADFVDSFSGRIQALARAHELIVDRRMEGAELSDLVREQVVIDSDSRRIARSGPPVMLDPKASVELALVLHELATNARKYGALSSPSGRLSIGWELCHEGGREIRLEWTESGGPPVAAPESAGFGTSLIERSLKARGGEAVIRYEPGGLVCHVRLPLSEDVPRCSRRMSDAARRGPPGADRPEVHLRGRRILVAEDEPLIAMNIEALLSREACEVVGPAETVGQALRLLVEERCDAAIIDVNLAGDWAGPLAAALTEKCVPFVFATGYGRHGLPSGFGHVPVLSKPFSDSELVAALSAVLRPAVATEPSTATG